MVLHARVCGSVGSCPVYHKARPKGRAFVFLHAAKSTVPIPIRFRAVGGFQPSRAKSATPQFLTSFCRKTYKLLINQENGSIQDQTIDKPERRSGCGFRRGVGPASRTARPSRSGLVGKLRLGVTAPSHPIGAEQKIS